MRRLSRATSLARRAWKCRSSPLPHTSAHTRAASTIHNRCQHANSVQQSTFFSAYWVLNYDVRVQVRTLFTSNIPRPTLHLKLSQKILAQVILRRTEVASSGVALIWNRLTESPAGPSFVYMKFYRIILDFFLFVFSFASNCAYTLLKDTKGTLTVNIEKDARRCKPRSVCALKLRIYLEDTVFTLAINGTN